ncbi:MAG TPA: glycosyltransferase family 4 protein [Solirubrobacteraceae bacterium]|jgi:glycosyltransferase involved in cell wall biosynthesis|nr:glycosyltransferase family 4 protein [Solirubrobacteraceae bacterium]
MKPVLFVTSHAPAYRVGAFACLHERENVEFALFGGRLKHGGGSTADDLPFPHRHVREHELYALAASGRYRAVVCPTGGRVAPLATWAGARRARVPLILWASLWAHPRSAAHALSYPALRRLYRSADAVVTYGPHVSTYVGLRGAKRVHVAPQSVDNAFWSSPDVSLPNDPRWPANVEVTFLFAGRATREKGLGVLVEAWSTSGLQAPTAALVLVGAGSTPPWVPAGGAVVGLDPVPQKQLRNFYAAADVLVVPSIPTRTFREPWGLVVNEAMNRGLPVIASDAVGAAAGGLLKDGRNGLVVPAGEPVALAAALRELADNPALRARMGAAGRADVSSYTYDAWACGFSNALAELSLSGGR